MTVLQRLEALLAQHDDVQALVLFGSQAANVHDEWSDVDVLAVMQTLNWATAERVGHALSQVRRVFSKHLHDHEDGHFTLRWCYTTFERVDLVLWDIEVLDGGPIPITPPYRVLFNDTVLEEEALLEPVAPPIPDVELYQDLLKSHTQTLRDNAITALVKVVRGDLLIALHLALDNLRIVLVLHMQLRDIQTGTTVHRTGGRSTELVLNMPAFPNSAEGIIDRLHYAAKHFDRLAREIDPTYKGDNGPLLDAIRVARQQIRVRGW